MKHSDGSFGGARGLSIYYQYWQPDAEIQAVMLIVHGAAEHSGRYQHVAEYFVGHGYAVVGLDHPGHGKSDGTPGFVESFDDYLQTLNTFYGQVVTDFPDLPVFLLGHSLGGLISSIYLLQHQTDFAGCVLSGPAIKTDLEPGLLQTWAIQLLAALFPRAGALQLDANGISRDPAEVERYRNDPLVYTGKLSARKIRELFTGMTRIQHHASEISLPMLLLHGGDDSLTSPAGSEFLYEQISSEDKTLKIYPGLYHEILNEPERDQVMGDVLSWCDRRIVAPTTAA